MLSYRIIDQVLDQTGAMQRKIDGTCLSTDMKPTNVENGSQLVEMDTGLVYFFDEENMRWIQFA